MAAGVAPAESPGSPTDCPCRRCPPAVAVETAAAATAFGECGHPSELPGEGRRHEASYGAADRLVEHALGAKNISVC